MVESSGRAPTARVCARRRCRRRVARAGVASRQAHAQAPPLGFPGAHPGYSPGAFPCLVANTKGVSIAREKLTPTEEAEERRLWADYYEAAARALEIMRAEGTTTATLLRIAAEDAKAAAAIKRIKEIRGLHV